MSAPKGSEHRDFVDALRGFLGLAPLYGTERKADYHEEVEPFWNATPVQVPLAKK